MSSRTYPCVLWHATRSPRANFNFHMRTCRTEPCYAQPQIFLPEPVWALTTESPTVQRASHVAVLPAGALLHHRFEVLGDVEGAASRLLDLLQRHAVSNLDELELAGHNVKDPKLSDDAIDHLKARQSTIARAMRDEAKQCGRKKRHSAVLRREVESLQALGRSVHGSLCAGDPCVHLFAGERQRTRLKDLVLAALCRVLHRYNDARARRDEVHRTAHPYVGSRTKREQHVSALGVGGSAEALLRASR